jgi:hypothetical protein
LIEIAHGSGELVTFFTFEEELGDFLAATLVVDGSGLFVLLILVLIFVMNRTEAILWVPGFVRCFFVLGFDFPNTLLVERERAPAVA